MQNRQQTTNKIEGKKKGRRHPIRIEKNSLAEEIKTQGLYSPFHGSFLRGVNKGEKRG